MDTCIVHFGMHKTGSSSIQKSLHRGLKDNSFHYVNLGKANASHLIASAFKAVPISQGSRKKGASRKHLLSDKNEIIQRLNSEFSKAQSRTAIISGEGISLLKEDEFKAFCDVITAAGKSVLAVGFIRSPKSYMESAFQQRVKRNLNYLDIDGLYPNYQRRFKKFCSVLGEKNVRFWRFDPASFPSRCVVLDFCKRVGINFQPNDVVRSNEGLSQAALSLLYAYRKYGPGCGVGEVADRENSLLIRHLSLLKGVKVHFHSSLVKPVIDDNLEDVAWMEERLGDMLTGDLYADDDNAIRSEEELLVFARETTQWLATQLGKEYESRWHEEMTPQEVANWVHTLRLDLAREDKKINKMKNIGG